jgi:hypothetical protein
MRRVMVQTIVILAASLLAPILAPINHGGMHGQPTSPYQTRPAPECPLLIKHGWDAPTAKFVAANSVEMDLVGYDGVVVRLASLWDRVPSSTPVSEQALREELGPITEASLSTLTHNFVITYTASGTRYFDDFSVPLENYRNLARVARELGFEGIVLDTEDYHEDRLVQDWPAGAPGWGIVEARQQAMLRGREVMAVLLAEWPDVTLLVMGGAWLAEPGTAEEFRGHFRYVDHADSTELRSAFFLGLAEGAVDTSATLVDGGALYTPRTAAEFQVAYDWLKTGMARGGKFVPESIRAVYPDVVSVAFGVYDRPWLGVVMDGVVWRMTLTNALHRTDRYVWAYTELYDWWKTGWPEKKVPQLWVDSTRAAKAAITNCGATP